MSAKGAQHDTAQGIPVSATIVVAKRKLRTKGAKNMVVAKSRSAISHAVCRSGRRFIKRLTVFAMEGGGRGVNFVCSDSGDRIASGKMTEAAKVTREKMTKERDPNLPTSPRASLDSWAAVGCVS